MSEFEGKAEDIYSCGVLLTLTLCSMMRPEEEWTAFHKFGADARHIAVITCPVQRLPIDNGPNRRVDIGIPRQRVVAR
jgi:hypothetical protein